MTESSCPPSTYGPNCQYMIVQFSVANSTPMSMVLAIVLIILLLVVVYYLCKSRSGMTSNVLLGRPDGIELVQRATATSEEPSLITRSVFLVTQSRVFALCVRVGRLLSDGSDEEQHEDGPESNE